MKSMQKPKIGISLRVVEAPSYDEKRDALSHDWPKLLEKLGFNPIYIPNTLSHVDEFFSDMFVLLLLFQFLLLQQIALLIY